MSILEVPSKKFATEEIKNESRILEVPSKNISILETSSKSKVQEVPSRNISSNMPEGQDEFSQMNPFMKAIDIISRPGYAVKSGIQEQILQSQGKKPVNIPERFKAMGRGFTGQERVSGNELLGSVGVSGIPLAGFATELATDPLMFMGGAGYKAIPKALSFVTSGARKIPGVEQIISRTKQASEPVINTVKKLFIDKTNLPELAEKIEKHLSKRQYLKSKSFQVGIKIRDSVQNISKKYKMPVDQIESQIVSAIEQPQLVKSMPKELSDITNFIKTNLSEMLTSEMKAGVPITALSGGTRGIQYFPRIAKEEAVKYLQQGKIGNKKVWNPKLANALQRKTGDFTLLEFNDFVKANGLEALGGNSIEQFFLKNPAIATVIRGSRSAKAITSAEFIDDVANSFGKVDAPDYWVGLPDTVTSLIPKLKNMKFDPGVAEEINRVTTKYFNPNEASAFIKGFDNVQNMWKRWTLAPFPKYHIRNMVGNFWNNYIADVNPLAYGKAQALQFYRKFKDKPDSLGFKTALKELDAMKISPSQADDIIRNAEETNVLGQGWYGADIDSAIEKAFRAEKGLIGRAMNFGKAVENNARLAHYLDRLDKGNDSMSAAMSVKKYLFDYSDLTDFERTIMKRGMPFYTWTRKNVPLQIQSLWEQPQKFAPISYELRDRNTDDLLKLKYTRPDLYERIPVEVRRDAESVSYVPLEGIIPAADLSKIGRPQEVVLELISPYIRGPLELAFNKSLHFENEIQKYDNETQKLLKLNIPVKLKYALTTFLPQARILNEVNKMLEKKEDGQTLTPGEIALEWTLSSVYKIDLKELKQRALQVLKRKMNDLDSGAYAAKKNLRPDEFERIKETYEEVKQSIRDVKQ